MRGADELLRVARHGVGIIPAHAGSRVSNPVTKWLLWDHPRACGEQSVDLYTALLIKGSSPRMRGAVPMLATLDVGVRIIPAHAGSR